VIIIAIAMAYGNICLYSQKNGPSWHARSHWGIQEAHRKTLLLTLEILVAADVIETRSLSKTFQSVALLGMLVVVRILLSLS
jgi:uncharacterized membrane protein